jgi:hypothetical protein
MDRMAYIVGYNCAVGRCREAEGVQAATAVAMFEVNNKDCTIHVNANIFDFE